MRTSCRGIAAGQAHPSTTWSRTRAYSGILPPYLVIWLQIIRSQSFFFICSNVLRFNVKKDFAISFLGLEKSCANRSIRVYGQLFFVN